LELFSVAVGLRQRSGQDATTIAVAAMLLYRAFMCFLLTII
jgi:hypothetical protein